MGCQTDSAEIRFEKYLDEIAAVVGHADRHKPLKGYITGLLLPGERKSVEPMAALIDPRHVGARHQSMHHFVAKADWDDAAVLRLATDVVGTDSRARAKSAPGKVRATTAAALRAAGGRRAGGSSNPY